MKIKMLSASLLLAVLASSSGGVVPAKQSKVVELLAKDGGSRIATIRVNDQSLLFESNSNSDAVLFSDEACFTINNKAKTYHVQSYAELQTIASRKAVEIAQSPENTDAAQGVELKLSDETDTISGLRARKLIKTSGGVPEAEFWVSSELVPQSLRAFGERLRTILPKDYWRRVHGNPGMVEIVMLFGVPLKMTYDGHNTYQARVVESSSSDSSFQVPAGYEKRDN
jgi:hypothetical protein